MSPKRRGAGEGSLFQRADGRWCAVVSLGYDTDGRNRKTIYGKTRREVAEKLRKLKADVEAGLTPSSRENVTVSFLLDEWLKLSVEQSRRAGTLRTYRSACQAHIKPALGTTKLRDVTAYGLQSFLDGLIRDKGKAPRTVAVVHIVIALALRQAVAWGWIARSPAEMVKGPKIGDGHLPPSCTPEAAVKIATVLRADPAGRPALVALCTGLRLGEVLGLKWSDINMAAATVKVSQQLVRADTAKGEHGWKLAPLKTRSSARQFALPIFLMEELRVLRAEQQVLGTQGNLGLVFTNQSGDPLAHDAARGKFQRLLNAAGLPHYRFHDLRHLYATVLISKGTHVKMLSDLMGHKNASTTLNVYSHLFEGASLDSARAIDSVLDPKRGPEER